ncbi:MAG: cysteine synthase A [Lentisphaerae bacterium]|jgi:cysteine synthase A|nr:cysteine synthase A [Lentisphaerota bacterium]
MSGIQENILVGIGNTPLVRINRMNQGRAELLAKVEYGNPGGSVKDRVALSMIEDAEKRGLLQPGGLIIEPTSGNTGIGLALVAAVKGYRLILTMPETMSIERRKLLAAYGAELVLTEGTKGMQGAIDKAIELQSTNPGSIIPQQFENAANPEIHRKVTAEEIWRDTGGKVDVFVSAAGTGGTLTGVGKGLLARNPKLHLVAVEPDTSAVLSGGTPGSHKLQGIGAGFIPKVLDTSIISEIIAVSADQAGGTARDAARKEGLLIGISSGAALYAALEISKRQEFSGKRIVVLLPDSGERYLSTWLFE